jgi:hypothetical protein
VDERAAVLAATLHDKSINVVCSIFRCHITTIVVEERAAVLAAPPLVFESRAVLVCDMSGTHDRSPYSTAQLPCRGTSPAPPVTQSPATPNDGTTSGSGRCSTPKGGSKEQLVTPVRYLLLIKHMHIQRH